MEPDTSMASTSSRSTGVSAASAGRASAQNASAAKGRHNLRIGVSLARFGERAGQLHSAPPPASCATLLAARGRVTESVLRHGPKLISGHVELGLQGATRVTGQPHAVPIDRHSMLADAEEAAHGQD